MNMAVHRNMAVRAARKGSCLALTMTTLDLGRLRVFLRQTLPEHAADQKLVTMAHIEYNAIMSRINQDVSIESCRDELVNCSTLLSCFLSGAATKYRLPSSVIYEAHSLMGCIHEILEQYTLASQSFTKALWIASSTATDGGRANTAVALHRLGRSYGLMGRYQEANNLLEKALVEYEAAHLHRDHLVVCEARVLMRCHEEKMVQMAAARLKQRQQSSPTLLRSKLGASPLMRSHRQTSLYLIREEDTPTGRRSSL
jgi:tetratricopeptide (TPR) repeat protein